MVFGGWLRKRLCFMPHLALSDFDPSKVGLHSFKKSPFAFMAMKVTDILEMPTLVISCMALLIIPCKIFKWDKPGSLIFVSYLEELKERERQTGKRWPFLYGTGPERMKWSEVAQSCLTLCNPKDCSLQAPSSMGFSRQEYWKTHWSGLPFPSPERMKTVHYSTS